MGGSMTPAPDGNDLRLLRAIYEKTGGRSRGVRDVAELESGLTEDAARAAWRSLLDQCLIERFSKDYAARLSVEGLEYIQNAPAVQELAPSQAESTSGPRSHKVFVAHGSGTNAREAVSDLIREMNLELVLLDEHSETGRTTMEQIEAHGEIGFAVMLLTPEDLRPSMNVLMELGYLIGRFGRTRIRGLVVDAIPDLPADLAGVALGSFDASGEWRTSLSRHLQNEGLA
jgi:predicted nucleotide-binding protein